MLAARIPSKVKTGLRIAGFITLSLMLAGVSLGQIKSGIIVGTVVDPSGAAVPGSTVTVINPDTNITLTAVTDENGSFTVPYLAAGTYVVEVEKAGSGFAKYRTPDITVSTAQTVKIEIKLQTGMISETVVITAEAAQLQASNATVQSLVNERTVQALPNITHNPFTYATLQAGVVPRGLFGNTQTTTSFGIGIDGRRQASAIGINGGSAFSNDIILDGVSIQGSAWNETAVLPNQDSLQEVRIISNNFTAEYGRAQGVVVFTTKSGTNDYHGTGFYRIRNEALNANGFSNNANRIPRGPFKSNTFGGTVGGRIIRDKAFFFVSYEGLRFHRSYPFLMTVPTEAERRGDFSNTYVRVGTANIPIKIYDPFSATRIGTSSNYQRTQFPTFIDAQGVERTLPLPAGRLNQFGMAVLNAYPMPNRAPDDIFNTNNFFSQGRQEFTKNNLNSRVDYNRGKHSFYATYGFQKGLILTPRSWGEDNQYSGRNKAGEFVGNNQPDNNPYFAFGDTVVFSPTLILDARIGVNRIKSDNEFSTFDDYDYSVFGIPAAIQAINVLPGVPPAVPVGSGAFAPVSPLNFGTSLHKRERQTNTDFNASMTWTRGRWTHKFGGTYRVLLSNYIDVDDSIQIRTGAEFTRKFINFDGGTSSLPATDARDNGSGLASMLLGAGSTGITPGFAVRLALAQKYAALYSQNDWRINNRLTVNLGLRWDVQPGPTERFNHMSSIDLNAREPLFNTPGALVYPGNTTSRRNLWETDYKNFGPRFGIAWQATDAMVLRGGYGLTYVPSNTGFNDGPGFYGAGAFTSSVSGLPYGTAPAGVVIAPFNSMTVNSIITPVGPNVNDPRLYGGARRFPQDYKTGYVQQWNAFVERKFGSNYVVSAGYLGSHGSRLQIVFVPINSQQLVDPALLESWRNTYIATNGSNNPATQFICNPFQTLQTCNPATPNTASGPLIPYGNGTIRNRTIQRIESFFPYPLQGDNITLSAGESDYHALQLQVNRQFGSGLQFNAHYTFSKQLGTTRYNAQTNQGYSDGGDTNYFPYVRPDLRHNNRKITTNDAPHRFVASWVYDLPIGRGGYLWNTKNSRLDRIVGSWRLGGSFTAQSGFVALISGGTGALNNLPDRVPGVPIEVPKELQRWYDGNTTVTLPSGRLVKPCAGCFLKYNVDAFRARTVTLPAGGAITDIFWYGNAAATYGDIRSNSNWNLNMSLDKNIRFGERYSLLLSAQATNALNHTQWKPGVNMAFGATSVAAGSVGAPQNPNSFGTYSNSNTYDGRQLELAAKFRF
ncbi:MAG TPA: TonB-dependent receptor [Pyrinomonadaceae bacterium]|jgi:Carboxypeptidase regulatory-like domain/TonB dependent receptor-like, beta-barrel